MLHEIDCPYPSFPHILACTCPGSETRRLLDAGRPSEYDPEKGLGAEKIAQRKLEREGWRVLSTRDAYSRFPYPGLANSSAGDLLLLGSLGEQDAVEVKEITESGARLKNVIMTNFSIEAGRFTRVWAVRSPEEIYEISRQVIVSRMQVLEDLGYKRAKRVPYRLLGHQLP